MFDTTEIKRPVKSSNPRMATPSENHRSSGATLATLPGSINRQINCSRRPIGTSRPPGLCRESGVAASEVSGKGKSQLIRYITQKKSSRMQTSQRNCVRPRPEKARSKRSVKNRFSELIMERNLVTMDYLRDRSSFSSLNNSISLLFAIISESI